MKRLPLITLVMVGLFAAGQALLSPAVAYTTRGMGNCNTWVGGTDDRFWLLGFISGYNYATDGHAARGTESDEIYRWVTRYCQQHPDDDLADAVSSFIRSN